MPAVLRSLVRSLILLAALPLVASEFQFDATGVTASVTPSATTYWMCACIGSFSGSTAIGNYHAIVTDADGDGIVRWELGNKMTPGGVFTMIDGTAETITTRYRTTSRDSAGGTGSERPER